jgi:hypothetical protein
MHKERLLWLARHLRSGRLGHENFDYKEINAGGTYENMCGTRGCALGELPIAFPDKWKFVRGLDHLKHYHPRLINSSRWSLYSDAKAFFELDEKQLDYLFYPFANTLGDDATADQVANLIEKFVMSDGEMEFAK